MIKLLLATTLCVALIQTSFGQGVQCPDIRSKLCTRDFAPVCGYGKDNKAIDTYSNRCTACSTPEVMKTVEYQCPENFFTVPSVEKAPIAPLLSDKPTLSQGTGCPSSRGHFCTLQFDPVCGYDKKQQVVGDFSNACVACSNRTVKITRKGSCSDVGSQTTPSVTIINKVKPTQSTKILQDMEKPPQNQNGGLLTTFLFALLSLSMIE